MTICNMSIEAGARAGMIAPDDTTFAYLEGRPHAPKGAAWEQALDGWRALAHGRGRRLRQRGRDRRRRSSSRRSPGARTPGWSFRSTRRCRIPPTFDDPDERAGSRARAHIHGARAGDADPGHRHRPRLHRLVHERPHRGPARGGGGRAGRRVSPNVRAMVVPGSATVKRQAEEEGLDRVFDGGGLRVAQGRLLDVPRHEPRHPRPRRALRVHVEPQLRGAAGARAAGRTSSAPRWPPRRRSPATSWTSASGSRRHEGRSAP